MHCTFFNISAATIVSKWRGDSEKIVKVLFDLARYYQPSTIFLDEIDSIMNKRSSQDEHEGSRRLKTELLIQLDGLAKKEGERVFLLAASNLPWDLDHALLRRLEKRVIVGLPTYDSRLQMLKRFIPIDKQKDLDYNELATLLENYSGSDIKLVCKECLMKGVRRAISNLEKTDTTLLNKLTPELVTTEDFMSAYENTKPASVYKKEEYEKWMKNYGSF
jgi:katanin p60 ATPase-containing subunit A1